jgi:hypothetical protein
LKKAGYSLVAAALVGVLCPVIEAAKKESDVPIGPVEPKTATVPIATEVASKTVASKAVLTVPKTALKPTGGLPKTDAAQPKPKQENITIKEVKAFVPNVGKRRCGYGPDKGTILVRKVNKDPGNYFAKGFEEMYYVGGDYVGDETFLGLPMEKYSLAFSSSEWRNSFGGRLLYVELPAGKTLFSSVVSKLAEVIDSPLSSAAIKCQGSCRYVIDEHLVRVLFKAESLVISDSEGIRNLEVIPNGDEPFSIGGGFMTDQEDLVIRNAKIVWEYSP